MTGTILISERSKYVLLLVLMLAISLSCARQPHHTPQPPLEPTVPPVGSVALIRAGTLPPENQQLDVGVLVFDAQAVQSQETRYGQWVFDEIRENESQYLPYVLRSTLVASDQWGAVRVLPEHDPLVDLHVAARIIASNGQVLELEVLATDSTGRQWLDKRYADVASVEQYPEVSHFAGTGEIEGSQLDDPFLDIYRQISNDLLAVRDTLSEQELQNIKRVSQILYARDLSPGAFADNLAQDENGQIRVARLPAEDDPMMARVQQIRLRHLVFIDTVDEYYQALHQDMQSIYTLWRRYSLEQALETEIAANTSYSAKDYGTSGDFISLSQRYDRFKWSKIYQREFTDLAEGFRSELAPAILELSERVYGLTGNMDDQYRQWRQILRSLFALETTGTTPGPN